MNSSAPNSAAMFMDTSLGRLPVLRAGPGDLNIVMSILLDAVDWLASRNIVQWTKYRTPKGRAQVAKRIVEHEVYFCTWESRPIATLTLQWSDVRMWGERGDDGQAGYIHAFAVVRAAGGKRIGRTFVDWASRLIAARGRPLVRLDTLEDNATLRAYYPSLGFTPRDLRIVEGWRVRLFERPAPQIQ